MQAPAPNFSPPSPAPDSCSGCPLEGDQTVCHCFDVSESILKQTIDEHGAGSVDELSEQTGAGCGCRACHCRLRRILDGLPAKCSDRFDF